MDRGLAIINGVRVLTKEKCDEIVQKIPEQEKDIKNIFESTCITGLSYKELKQVHDDKL